ncbi:hypothetical protein ANN_02356, partial [Periplaneta americana]
QSINISTIQSNWTMCWCSGQYQVADLAKCSAQFYSEYGHIVKLSGLVGRPDLLFVYDADEIEKIYRTEGPTPFRPSMPCLVYYKSVVRKDFFGDLPGVVGVHGEPWRVFRTKVQKPILQLQTVKKYIEPIEDVTQHFIKRRSLMLAGSEFQSLGRAIVKEDEYEEVRWDGIVIAIDLFEHIEQRFLLSGHSFLQCDSDFALIEKRKKVTKVFNPSDLLKIVQDSQVVKPFQAVPMLESDFRNIQDVADQLISNKNLNISKACCIQYDVSKAGRVSVKQSHDNEAVHTIKKEENVKDVQSAFFKLKYKIGKLLKKRRAMIPNLPNEEHRQFYKQIGIGRVALDVRLGCLDPDLPVDSEPQRIIDAAKYALRNVAILELKAPFWRYVPTPLWTRYVKNMDYFIQVCMKYIDIAVDRLKTKQSVDDRDLSLVERILAEEPDPKTACILALDLILVGIDTISMAVCSILYQLATRPEEQEKIHAELTRVLPSADTPLTSRHLDQMQCLRAFVKEVFRMYSTVIGNGRTLQNDTVICGYRIPKVGQDSKHESLSYQSIVLWSEQGSEISYKGRSGFFFATTVQYRLSVQLVFPTIVTGNMEEYVNKADEFLPERWLKNSGESLYRIHPFASLPYGHGARMCLGRRFADLEIQILLAKASSGPLVMIHKYH